MEINSTVIWIIGGIIVIVIALLVAKKVKVSFGKLNLEADKNKIKSNQTNEMIVKGNKNKLKQDVNSQKSDNKDNKMNLEGDKNELEQDTNK